MIETNNTDKTRNEIESMKLVGTHHVGSRKQARVLYLYFDESTDTHYEIEIAKTEVTLSKMKNVI